MHIHVHVRMQVLNEAYTVYNIHVRICVCIQGVCMYVSVQNNHLHTCSNVYITILPTELKSYVFLNRPTYIRT